MEWPGFSGSLLLRELMAGFAVGCCRVPPPDGQRAITTSGRLSYVCTEASMGHQARPRSTLGYWVPGSLHLSARRREAW